MQSLLKGIQTKKMELKPHHQLENKIPMLCTHNQSTQKCATTKETINIVNIGVLNIRFHLN